MPTRTLQRVIAAIPTSDGAGVKLQRSLGQSDSARLDPFLMLDHFSTDNPHDYIAGFPAHPHRGFETVTYMLDGHMRHQDHLGNTGDLKAGGVQWMSAGRGIIHSEMPQQEAGRMRGFQLWINLPASEKMKPAGYRDIQATEIPVVELPGGIRVDHKGTFQGEWLLTNKGWTVADPLYFDVELPAGATFRHALPAGRHAFIYPFEGSVAVGAGGAQKSLATHHAGILSDGDAVEFSGGPDGGRFILLAGRPLLEPIVQYGPFVMNTREEIEQAVRDYQSGTLTGTETARA